LDDSGELGDQTNQPSGKKESSKKPLNSSLTSANTVQTSTKGKSDNKNINDSIGASSPTSNDDADDC
jgi:hypothetical protein